MKGIVVVLSAIPITLILGSIGLFRSLETPVLDFLTMVAAGQHRNVVIVRIDDHDYKNKFNGKSPLDPKVLGDVLCAIAKGGPSVIGVDIDTSGPEFREFKPDPKCLNDKPWPPIVWARGAAYSNYNERYQVFDVLGNQDPPPLSGFVAFKLDSDETIRHYVRVRKADDGKAEFAAASFPWAIVKLVPDKSGALQENDEERLIKFQGEPKDITGFNFDIEALYKIADGEGWRINGPVTGKIVLLGGDYAAQDEHKTPVGCMLGVEVMAQIIETELAGGGITSPSAFLRVALAVFSTLLLVFILSNFKSYKRIVVCILLIPLLAGLSSYTAFRSLSQFPTFALVLVIILGYILFQQIKEEMKQRKEMNTVSK